MCGLYGIFNYGNQFSSKDIHSVIKQLGITSMERGTHATGIAYLSKNRLNIFKAPKPACDFDFKIPVGTKAVIGHTRHTTQGHHKRNRNNHPWLGCATNQQFALAHNGLLFNDRELRRIKRLPNTHIETDSYIAVQLLNKEKLLNMESIKSMAETVEGLFVFTILDDSNSLYIVKSNNPVTVVHFKELKTYFYASTEQILWRGLVNSSLFGTIKSQFRKNPSSIEEITITDGQILKIEPTGKLEYGRFKATDGYGYYHYSSNLFDKEYWAQLKNMAFSCGYDPSIIDALYDEGYHPDEIEDFIYTEHPSGGTDRIANLDVSNTLYHI